MPDENEDKTAQDQALENLIGDESVETVREPETKVDPPRTEPVEKPEDSRYTEMMSRLARMEEQNAELRAENAVHRASRGAAAVRTTPVEQPAVEEDDPDDDTFREQAKTAPVRAIRTIVDRAVKRAVRETEQRLEGRLGAQTANERYRQRTLAEYGDALSSNRDLAAAAEAEYAALADERGGHRPADMYTAVATAYATLVRTGKIKPTNGNGGGDAQPLRERVRQPTAPNADSGRSGPDAQPQTPFQRDFRTEAELRGARASAKKFNLTMEQFIKSYNEEAKGNPNYGTGR